MFSGWITKIDVDGLVVMCDLVFILVFGHVSNKFLHAYLIFAVLRRPATFDVVFGESVGRKARPRLPGNKKDPGQAKSRR